MLRKIHRPALIFIVEDNRLYAKSLEAHLRNTLSRDVIIRIFPVAELCIDEMKHKPDVVILDHYLNSRYHDAVNGLDVARDIRISSPGTKLILLSSQSDMKLAFEAVHSLGCNYIVKDDSALERLSKLIA
jgi:DNA-binding NarL/FixJ family response regulator